MRNENMTPEISVIVPALNEERYIGHVFEGLSKQTFKNFETIVVDGGSTDKTVEKVGKKAKLITETRKGPGIARNAGARIARGHILLFLDADTKPSKELLGIYAKAFKDKSVSVATGPIKPLEKTDAVISAGYAFVSVFFVRLSILVGMPAIVGANFAVRKSAFENVKGFDPKMLTYDDWDLSLRLKNQGRMVFIDDALVYTSIRRVREWGLFGFIMYHVENMIKYNLFKEPKTHYQQIR